MYWHALAPPIKRAVRELAAKAYQRELSAELARLHDAFAEWKAGSLGASQLADKVQRVGVEVARELTREYKFNANLDLAVASAIARGVLAEEEIPAVAREHLMMLAKSSQIAGVR